MGQRKKSLTPEQIREARQRVSDELCRALNLEPFDVPDGLQLPSGFSPMTSPGWVQWSTWAYRAHEHAGQDRRHGSRVIGIDFNPLEWARNHSPKRRDT